MNDLTVTEYKDIRVLTTQQIADAYESNADTITKNFNRNRDRYIAMNCSPNNKTVEFRIFNSSTRVERILKNYEIVFSLIDFTNTFSIIPQKKTTQVFK